MTSGNTSWNKPFLLKPAAKDYLWGGNRLNDDFSKNIRLSPLAETWECSTHPDGVSLIASGPFAGTPLDAVLRAYPELLGARHARRRTLPILIKLIDAKQDLSVQVHPDDAYAAAHENGQLGKTEMWYVLDAAKNTSLIYGLRHSVSREELRTALEKGTVEAYLQRVPVHPDDVYYLAPGTIHALGAGSLVAEIQENSNLTYRLYDYDRVDRQGKKRPLHMEKALEVANLKAAPEPKQPLRVLRFQRGCAVELLCRCKYFQAERMVVNTERFREMALVQTDGLSFQSLLCVEGCGVLFTEEDALPVFKGDCIFLPANSGLCRIHGKAKILRIRC